VPRNSPARSPDLQRYLNETPDLCKSGRITLAQVANASTPPVGHISPIHAALYLKHRGQIRWSVGLADKFHQEFTPVAPLGWSGR
jgi:hypothetical protein